MRDSYVPLFKDTLTSSLWACDLEVRIAWFFLLLQADEEGFVSGTVPGLAQQAHVSVEGMRRALAAFEAPDPDSRSQEHQGRRLERVARGWRVLGLVAARERARAEAERARKRRWAQEHRARECNDEPETGKGLASSGSMEEPAGQSMHPPEEPAGRQEEAPSNAAPKEEALAAAPAAINGAWNPPAADVSTPRSAPVDVRKRRRTLPPPPPSISKNQGEAEEVFFHDLVGFEPSAGFVTYAERYGLPPMALHARLRKIRERKVRIGGRYGVPDREQWCRDQLPRWKKWWLEDAGAAEPLPVTRRQPERPSSPLPDVGSGVPMPEALQRFVATGILPPKTAPPAAEVAA